MEEDAIVEEPIGELIEDPIDPIESSAVMVDVVEESNMPLAVADGGDNHDESDDDDDAMNQFGGQGDIIELDDSPSPRRDQPVSSSLLQPPVKLLFAEVAEVPLSRPLCPFVDEIKSCHW